MIDYGLHELWATPIVKVKNPDHGQIKQALVQFSYDSEKRAGMAVESGVTPHLKNALYESTMDIFNSTPLPEMKALLNFCLRSVGEVAAQLRKKLHPQDPPLPGIGVVIHESWIHVTRDRGYHDMHTHPNCSWCGIYTIEPGDCDPKSLNGNNRFDSPIEPAYIDLGSDAYITSSMYVCPEDGLLVLFPSYLRHSAVPYAGSRDRIVLAFNSRVFRPDPSQT